MDIMADKTGEGMAGQSTFNFRVWALANLDGTHAGVGPYFLGPVSAS